MTLNCCVPDDLMRVYKGFKFYTQIQLFVTTNTEKSLVDFKIRCVIKESTETNIVLFDLTEDNNGVIPVNDEEGEFGIYIPAHDTNVEADHGVFAIYQEYIDQPEREDKILVQGKVEFISTSKGV